MAQASLIILAFNEIEGIRAVLPSVPMNLFSQVLAVDAGSTDGTLEYYKEHGIPVVSQPARGRGAALRLGLQHAEQEHVVFFSPDGNEDPQDMPKLLSALEQGLDLVIASRFLPGGRNEEDTRLIPIRAHANRAFTWIANRLWNRGPYVTDTINGYRAIRRSVCRELDLDENGFVIEYQMTVRCMRQGIKIGEIPTREGDRIGGVSRSKSIPTGIYFLRFLAKELAGRRTKGRRRPPGRQE